MRGLLVLIALVGCGGASAPRAAAPEAEPAPAFRFDWSPPCEVPVTITSRKPDRPHEVTHAARLVVGAAASDGTMKVALVDTQTIAVDGRELDAAEREAMAAARQTVDALGFAWRVSAEGRVVSVEGMEEVAALLAGDADAETQAKVDQMMQHPDVRSGFVEQVEKNWATWVSRWIGWSLDRPATQTEQATVELLGARASVTVVREHLGDAEGLARLRRTERRRGHLALGSMLAFEIVAGEIRDGRPREELLADTRARYAELAVEIVQEVEVDPDRLRPRRARYDARFTHAGEPTGHEYYEATFDWARAVGCGGATP